MMRETNTETGKEMANESATEGAEKTARSASGHSQRRVSLQTKVVGFLLVISLIPLAVAAVLINQTAEVAHNFATNETAFLRPPLEKAKAAYIELIETKRDLYYRQVALRAASLPEVMHLAAVWPLPPADAPSSIDPHTPRHLVLSAFDELLQSTHELQRLAIIAQDGELMASRESVSPLGVDDKDWRGVVISQPIPGTQARLDLTFAASLDIQADYAALSLALQRSRRIDEIRSALPASYRMAFTFLVGGVVLVVSAAGIIVARRFAKRIFALVTGTREVAAGDLRARVELRGTDELAELAWAFNRMVKDLAQDREQIAYLQRVGAWQDVARKLAHEIKNPLTPIQLAVQQCVSSYKGDDARYRRLLTDTEEIVTEEISSLRRLVDAFRTLGQLPRVEPKPLALATVVEDVRRDPALGEHMETHAPDAPVMIRGDRQLLRRVLANLVENGIHAGQGAGRPGKVVIRWSADKERVRLVVDDDGPGVPDKLRDKIFEPYITHKEQGTGLGLTIAKKIAIEHRGSLELAEANAPSGGARFVLTLPLADATDTEVAEAAEDSEAPLTV